MDQYFVNYLFFLLTSIDAILSIMALQILVTVT